MFWIYAGLGAGMATRRAPFGGPSFGAVLRALMQVLPVIFFAIGGVVAQAPALVIAGIVLLGMGDLARLRLGRDARAYGYVAVSLGVFVLMLGLMAQSGAPIWGAFELRPLMAVLVVSALFSAEIWLMPYCGKQAWLVRAGAYLCAGLLLAAWAIGEMAVGIGASLLVIAFALQAIAQFRAALSGRFFVRFGRLWPMLGLLGQALILWGTSIALH